MTYPDFSPTESLPDPKDYLMQFHSWPEGKPLPADDVWQETMHNLVQSPAAFKGEVQAELGIVVEWSFHKAETDVLVPFDARVVIGGFVNQNELPDGLGKMFSYARGDGYNLERKERRQFKKADKVELARSIAQGLPEYIDGITGAVVLTNANDPSQERRSRVTPTLLKRMTQEVPLASHCEAGFVALNAINAFILTTSGKSPTSETSTSPDFTQTGRIKS